MATVEDSLERMDRLLARSTTIFRREFLGLIQGLRDERTLEELAELLRLGRGPEALAGAELAAGKLSAAYRASYTLSGDGATGLVDDAIRGAFSFNATGDRAIAHLRATEVRLLRGFINEQRAASTLATLDAIGRSPLERARAFRQSLGLTRRQMIQTINYRRLLSNLDSSALDRALRDKRFDRTLRRAISSSNPLSSEQIDRMVDRYAAGQLRHRVEVASRLEALRSVAQGTDEGFRQALLAGVVESVDQGWFPRDDGSVRASHAAMRGQVRPLGEAFVSGLGNRLRHPGDPAAPAEDVIGCRCRKRTVVRIPEEVAA
jgi:hypothetical protein